MTIIIVDIRYPLVHKC